MEGALAQRPEEGANFFGQRARLLEGGEMPAFRHDGPPADSDGSR
jgi:hypothetical protein